MAKQIKNVLLRLEAGGKTLVAGTDCEEYKIYEADGFAGLDFDFNMVGGPLTPNSVITNKKPSPRQITLGIHTTGANRDFLNAFFNPFERGKLTVTWDKVTRFIHYYPYPVKIEQRSVYRRVAAEASLLCPEPYWLDPDDYGRNIAAKQPLLAFPFVMLRKKVSDVILKHGLVADYKIYNQEVVIRNKGDVPVPAQIVFTTVGNVKNPRLSINNAEFVRAVLDMKKGDTLAFSTDTDNLYAKLNDEDILNLTDPDMTFFQIPKGEHIIRYGADEGTGNLNAYIYFRARHLGI